MSLPCKRGRYERRTHEDSSESPRRNCSRPWLSSYSTKHPCASTRLVQKCGYLRRLLGAMHRRKRLMLEPQACRKQPRSSEAVWAAVRLHRLSDAYQTRSQGDSDRLVAGLETIQSRPSQLLGLETSPVAAKTLHAVGVSPQSYNAKGEDGRKPQLQLQA